MKLLYRLGIGIIDLLILTAALCYLYLLASPATSIAVFTIDAFWLFVIIVASYFIVIMFTSLCLTYMREDNTVAKFTKGLISSILIISLFSWVIPPVLWLFGYDLAGDVRTVLIIAGILRFFVKLFLGRWLGGKEVTA